MGVDRLPHDVHDLAHFLGARPAGILYSRLMPAGAAGAAAPVLAVLTAQAGRSRTAAIDAARAARFEKASLSSIKDLPWSLGKKEFYHV